MRMKWSPELHPNGWDALAAAAVVILALVSGALLYTGGHGGGDLTAVVSVDGGETDRVDLAALTGPEERVYESRGYTLRVTFTEGSAQVTASDCPTQDCVHTGAITRSGQSIVCLPARLIVELESTGDTDGPDVVIG